MSLAIVGNGLTLLTTLLAWTFVVQYHLMAPWWRSEMGRHVQTYSVIVALVLTLSTVRIIAGPAVAAPWFVAIRLVVFAGVPAALAWRIAILWRVQRRAATAERNRKVRHMQPSIGRIVHYVSYGTPGGEYKSTCRAAIVTAVYPETPANVGDTMAVSLCVMNPTGLFLNEVVRHHSGDPDHVDATPDRPTYVGGTWHWPERV